MSIADEWIKKTPFTVFKWYSVQSTETETPGCRRLSGDRLSWGRGECPQPGSDPRPQGAEQIWSIQEVWWGWALTGNSLLGLCWGPWDQGQPGEPPDLLLPPTTAGHWGAQRVGAAGGPSGRGLGDSWGTWGRRRPDFLGLIPFQRFSPNPPSGLTQAPWSPRGAQ